MIYWGLLFTRHHQTAVFLTNQLGSMLSTMGLPYRSALKTAKLMVKTAIAAAKKDGTLDLPITYGDDLLAKETTDEITKEYLGRVRAEGATDADIRSWWNLHDLERRVTQAQDEFSRLQLFTDRLQKGFDPEVAAREAKTLMALFGDPAEAEDGSGMDRPLPYELKDRVNNWIQESVMENGDWLKSELKKSSSFNALIRRLLLKQDEPK